MKSATNRTVILGSLVIITLVFLIGYHFGSEGYQCWLISHTAGASGTPSYQPFAQLTMGGLYAGVGLTTYEPSKTSRFGGSYHDLRGAAPLPYPRVRSGGALSLCSTRGHCIGVTFEISGRNFALLLPLPQ